MPGDFPVRHALVWIRPARRAQLRAEDPAREGDVARWVALGRPAVARRRDGATGPDEVALAIALPAALGRARVAFAAPASAIARVAPPLRLAEALASAPPEWVEPLSDLDGEARAAGLVLRVYGSLAWQHLAGEAYLRPGSDVDLIAPGATPIVRARSLALLRRWEAHASPRLDGEVELGGGRSAAWRELLSPAARVLVKSSASVAFEPAARILALAPARTPPLPPGGEGAHGASVSRTVEDAALAALREELATEPKPGLVSPSARGAHADMDARTFHASLRALRGYFADAAAAGAAAAPFETLRALGVAAEARMLRATGGVNTHRGAIFALGLLSAAAGRLLGEGRACTGDALADAVRTRYGDGARRLPPAPGSHGAAVRRAHGAPGAREEAALGFPHVFEVGLPALEESLRRGAGRNAARVQALLAIVARLPDTNLLHRGGAEGLSFARRAAAAFLLAGGVHRPGWRAHAREIDRALVARNLSPGGSADLLAATLFAHRVRSGPSRGLSLALSPARAGEEGGRPAGAARGCS